MNNMTRRRMLTAIGVAGAGTCVCGMNSGCSSFTKVGSTPAIPPGSYRVEKESLVVDLDKVSLLAEVGGSVKVIDSALKDRLIIARTVKDEFAVVSLLCPHRGCEVEYRHDKNEFRCSSLGHSRFRIDGSKIKGFAKSPLKKYSASLDPASAGQLVIAL